MIESIEKLRTFARNMAKGSYLVKHEECNLLLIIADEIEAEVESRYVLLPEGWTDDQASDVLDLWPKWDDGSPCMFGDEFTCYPKYDHREQYEVFDRLTIYGRNHVWHRGEDRERPHDGGFYEWNYMRPGGDGSMDYRPKKRTLRTIEDALADFASKQHGITKEENDALIAECAEKIRVLMEVD